MNNEIKQQDIIADLHTHTTFSLHAYSSIKENIEYAKKAGLKYIAITDHFYNDGTILDKKNETNRIKYLEERVDTLESGITVIGGAEFNLNQPIEYWDKLKTIRWRPIGLHNWFIETNDITLDDLYQLFMKSIDKHNAFVHIEREIHKINNKKHKENLDAEVKIFFQKMINLAKENDILLEVNESSLITNECGGAERLKYWLTLAKENGNLIYLGTDAHYCEEVGKFDNAIKLLNSIKFPKERIINCNEELLRKKLEY